MGTSSGANFQQQPPTKLLPPRQQPRPSGLQTSLSLVSSDARGSPDTQEPGSNSEHVRESPSESASSQETWPMENNRPEPITAKKVEKEKEEGESYCPEQSVIRRVSSAEKITLRDVARERVEIISERMRTQPEELVEGLKSELRVILEGTGGSQNREEFLLLQRFVQCRPDLTAKSLIRAHRVQLEILVAINTGIQAFLHPNISLPQTSLIEVFLYKRCRNIACQSQLPPDDCSCSIFPFGIMSPKRLRDGDEQSQSDGHNPSVRKQKKVRRSVTIEANEELLSSISELVKKEVKKEVKKVRKEVKKEIKKKFGRLRPEYRAYKKRHFGKQMDKSASRRLQLKFTNKLSLPIFTLTEVEGKDPSVLTINLVDAVTGQVVKSGPESLMKVEIVILQGHFEGDEDNNWTSEHFSNNIVREGKDKRPLLTGDVFLTLDEGVGVARKLKITDNSSRTKSRKFRLAARVPDGYFDGMRVKEAITEPFAVKERRGKSYEKKHPPSLDDEVWRLDKIGKELHKRLSSEKINTVKDFLTMLHADTPRLRKILGPGMNDKGWEVIKTHAEECDPGSEMCVYYSKDEPGKGVVFNIVGTVIGILLEGRFIPINGLPEIQKVEMQQMIKVAYEHWGELDPYADGTILGSSSNVPVDSLPCVSIRPENPTDIFSSSRHCGKLSFLQPSESSPAVMMSSDDLAYISDVEIALDDFWDGVVSQEDHGNTTSSFSKPSVRSVAATWMMLITVMKFSKRIVALKDPSDARNCLRN